VIKKHKSIKCSLYTHAVYCRELFRRILSTSCQQPLLVFEISSAITLSVVPNTSCKSINIRKHTEAANRVEVMAGILQLGQVTIILYNFYLYPFQLYPTVNPWLPVLQMNKNKNKHTNSKNCNASTCIWCIVCDSINWPGNLDLWPFDL